MPTEQTERDYEDYDPSDPARPLTNEEILGVLETHGFYIDEENGPLAAKNPDNEEASWDVVEGLTRSELEAWIKGSK